MRHARPPGTCCVNVAKLKAGEWVLIMGAGGNLGSIGIQIAKNVIGATVIAAAGSRRPRAELGLDLGADYGINYNTQDIRAEVHEDHRRQGRQRALRQHRQSQGAAEGVPRARP